MSRKLKNVRKFSPADNALAAQVRSKLNQAVALHQQGRLQEAMTLYADILKIQPQHFDAIHLLGVIADQFQNHQLAADLIAQAISINPNNADAHFNRGNALKELNQLDAAAASYDKAIKLKPNYANACINRGIVLHGLKQFDAAVASYDKAVRIDPNRAEVFFNRGVALQELNRIDEALASYNRAAALKSDYAAAHYNAGVALHRLKRFEEALASYDRAIALVPDYAEAHANRGVILQELKRFDEALASADRAIALKPDDADAYFNRANALTELGRLDDAVAGYEKATIIKAGFAEAHLQLGRRHYDLDDAGPAADAYQKACDLDPADFGLDAAVDLAILHFLAEDYEQCRARLDASRPILAKTDAERKNICVYWRYLDRLLAWRQTHRAPDPTPGAEPLYVIGESHALAANGVAVSCGDQAMRCMTEWISGCKQWHLGNGNRNKYKHRFEAVMARLPRESAILLMIGEIDCRHDEGIIQAQKKSPDHLLDDIARSTIKSYLSYVTWVAARRGHRLIIAGVPAPNIQMASLSKDEAGQLVHLIRIFNATLKEQALPVGMGFLDVYALTDRSDGIASGDWHIDTHHLLPSAFAEAFCKHYVP
jgi:tetratricopeptide (TPR) repeat protein